MREGWLFDRYVIIYQYLPALRRHRWRAVDVDGHDYCFSQPAWFDRLNVVGYVVLVTWTQARNLAALEYPPAHPPGTGLHSPRSLREP